MAQIGTVRLQTQNNGTVSVPVFDTSDAGGDIYDMVRVQTASGTGFIPFVDPPDAAYPYLRVQTQNHGVVAAHNDAALQQIVDDFEDGDLNEYNQSLGSGNATAQTGTVYEGTYALEISISNGDNTYIESLSGLANYPSAGDTFEYRVRTPNNSDNHQIRTGFGVQGSFGGGTDYYEIAIRTADGQFNINRKLNNNFTTLSGTGVTTQTNAWMRVEVDWGSGGNIDARLYDSGGSLIASTSANDSSFSSGGIGFSNRSLNNDSRTYWDAFYII